MEAFLGSWKLESNEGLSEMLIRLGAGVIARTTMNASKPLLIFARESGPDDPTVGEVFSIKTQSKLKSVTCSFRMGYAFDETTMDGRTVRTVFTMDGDTLKQEQTGTKTTYITYNIEGDSLKMVIKVEELTCFRTFKRVLLPHSTPTTKTTSTAKPPESFILQSPPSDVKEPNRNSTIIANGV